MATCKTSLGIPNSLRKLVVGNENNRPDYDGWCTRNDPKRPYSVIRIQMLCPIWNNKAKISGNVLCACKREWTHLRGTTVCQNTRETTNTGSPAHATLGASTRRPDTVSWWSQTETNSPLFFISASPVPGFHWEEVHTQFRVHFFAGCAVAPHQRFTFPDSRVPSL